MIIQNYIIVDDDTLNNKICSMRLRSKLGEVDIKTFSAPEEGLAYIQNEYTKIVKPTILFLDINMPTLTGWEFLDQYDELSEEVKEHISIYILSSSIDMHDKNRAQANKYVKGFISKPLEIKTVLSIAGV